MGADALPPRRDPSVWLVPLGPGDAACYRALYTDPAVMRHVGGALSPDAADAAFAIVCRQVAAVPRQAWYWQVHRQAGPGAGSCAGLAAVVMDAGASRMTGVAPPSAELGVVLAPPAQAAGLATAAIAAIAAELFAHTALQCLWTRHASAHAAAAALMRTLGFQPLPATAAERRWSLSRARWADDPSLGCARRDGGG